MKRFSTLIFLLACGFSSLLAQTNVGAATNSQKTPATFVVAWLPPTVVITVTCPQTTLEGGQTPPSTMVCTVTLSQAAPSDKQITPSSSDTTKLTVSPPFKISAGATTGTFTVTAL